MAWILLNFSSDDQDPRISEVLLDPEWDILQLLNFDLNQSYRDDSLTSNILWIISNLLGERKPEATALILRKTDILDFMLGIVATCQQLPS